MKSFLFAAFAVLMVSACAETADLAPVLSPGDAVATGEMCGGMMGITCAGERDFCRHAQGDQCGAADQMGTCTTKPEMCTMDYRPVCGCDGKTYSNACMASANGASVLHDGACKETE